MPSGGNILRKESDTGLRSQKRRNVVGGSDGGEECGRGVTTMENGGSAGNNRRALASLRSNEKGAKDSDRHFTQMTQGQTR